MPTSPLSHSSLGQPLRPLLRHKFSEHEQRATNRFADDFIPEPVASSSSPLVYEALAQLSRTHKYISREVIEFELTRVPKPRHCVHVIDQESQGDSFSQAVKHVATNNHQSESASSTTSKDSLYSPTSRSRPQLADLFNRSGTSSSTAHRDAQTTIYNDSSESLSGVLIPLRADQEQKLCSSELCDESMVEICSLESAQHDANLLCEQYEDERLFWHYQPDYVYSGSLEVSEAQRTQPPMFSQAACSTHILAVMKRLTLCFGNIEPFFCSMALYDISENGAGKISENFHFDLNSEDVLSSTLSVFRFSADDITLCKNAVFSVPGRHDGVYLVIRIERVLQGDPDAAFEPYLKDKNFLGSQRPKSELDKIFKRMRGTINRLATYRQSFAVALIPLFSVDGELLISQDNPLCVCDKIFIEKAAVEEDAYIDHLRELASQLDVDNALLKRKIIPSAEIVFELYMLDDEQRPFTSVDPSLIPLKPTDQSQQFDKIVQGITKEVECFGWSSDSCVSVLPPTPYTHFVNSIYVYPLKVQFQKYRNIATRIELRLTDHTLESEGVKTIFGKSSSTAFCSSAMTQVVYHNKSPAMLDEFKIMLPLQLTEHAHLFFTFYQVACQNKVGKPAQDLIGYSMMPIFKGSQIAPGGVYKLPIAARLPDHYLLKFEARKETPQVHFRMQSSDCFRIRLEVLSSVFCQDVCLNKFVSTLPQDESLDKYCDSVADINEPNPVVETAVEYVMHTRPQALVQFLPPILNYLFSLMRKSHHDSIKYAAFRAIDIVVYRVGQFVDDTSFRTNLIISYVNYNYDAIADDEIHFFSCTISRLLVLALNNLNEDETNVSKQIVLRNVWFWFEILFKSTIQETSSDFMPARIHATLVKDVSNILIQLSMRMPAHRSVIGVSALKAANSAIAVFLCDLFAVLDSRCVNDLIVQYFESIDAMKDSVLLDFKIRFIELIFDFESFHQVSGLLDKINLSPADDDVVRRISLAFPLPAMLVHFVDRHLDFTEKTLRGQVITCLRRIVTRHEFDASIATEARGRLAVQYLPLLQALADQYHVVLAMPLKQQRSILAVAVWIVKTSDTELCSEWIRTEDDELMTNFCLLMRLAAQRFAYVGKAGRRTQLEFDAIISDETAAAIFGVDPSEIGSDLKSNIEQLMSSLRKGANALQNQSVKGRSKLSLRQRRAQMAASGSMHTRTKRNDTNYATETINAAGGDEVLKQLTDMEQALNANIGSALVKFCVYIFRERWMHPTLEFASSMFLFFSAMLECAQELSVTLALYPLMKHAITSLTLNLYTLNSVDEFARRLLEHCCAHNRDMRSSSSSLVFIIARADFLHTSSFTKFQESITVSLSHMVTKLHGRAATYLDQAFRAVHDFALLSDVSDDAVQQLQHVMKRVCGILADTREIARQETLDVAGVADASVYAELLVHMSEAYSHLPRVQIQWLERLADRHTRNAAHAEAAYALTHIADLIQTLIPPHNTLMHDTMNLRKLTSFNNTNVYEHFTNVLRESCNELHQAQLYEQCNQAYHRLVPVFETYNDYEALAKAHLHLHTVFDELVTSISTQSRLLGTYYRVAFYGEKFGDVLNAKQFIYKMPKITRLAEIVELLRGVYSRQFGTTIKIWPDSARVQTHTLAPDELVLQCTYVTPCFDDDDDDDGARHDDDDDDDGARHDNDDDDGARHDDDGHVDDKKRKASKIPRVSFVERNTKLDAFTFSTPFTSDTNAAHASGVTKQQRRNTIVRVAHQFPCMLLRQPVTSIEEIVLSPVQSSTENIILRVNQINDILRSDMPDRKQLTNVLQGSLMLQVHGGVAEICEAFFDDEGSFDDDEALPRLREVLLKFLDVCDAGVELFGTMLDSDEQAEAQRKVQDSSNNSSPSRNMFNATNENIAVSTDRNLFNEMEKHARALRQRIMPRLRTEKKTKANVRFAVASNSPPSAGIKSIIK